MAASILDLATAEPAQSIPQAQAIAATRNRGGVRARAHAESEAIKQAAKVEENTGFRDLVGAAMVEGTPGLIDRMWSESQVSTLGTEFQLPTDFVEQMHRYGIEPGQWEIFSRATNQDHYDYLVSIAHQNELVKETQAQYGVLANVGASMLDPGAFALDSATAGLSRAATAGRVANAARNALVAASTNTALSVANGHYNTEIDGTDHALAAASGIVLGGLLGAHRGEAWVPPKQVEDIVKRDIASEVSGSTESLGAAKVAGIPDNRLPGLSQRTVSDALEEHKGTDADELNLRPAYAPVRRSLSARMGNMKAPSVRKASRWLFRDGVGYNDRNVAVRQSAGQKAALDRATFETRLMRSWNAAWTEHRAANPGITRNDEAARLTFSREVAEVLRGGNTKSPAVKAAASEMRSVLDDLHDLRVRAGLAGPEDKAEDYFPQIQSAQNLSKVYGDMGVSEDQVEEVYFQSILSRMKQDADAEQVANFKDIEDSYRGTSDAALRAREKADDHNATRARHQQAVTDAEARIAEVKDIPGAKGDRMRNAAQRRHEAALRKLQRSDERFDKSAAKLKEAIDAEEAAKYALKQAKAVAHDGGIDADLARAYAKALVARGRQKVLGETSDAIRPLDLEDLDQLKEVLEEAGANTERVTSILSKYTAQAQENAKLGNARKRIRLDPSFRTKLVNRRGEEVELGVTDFMENDALRVVNSYARDSIGWSAIATNGNIRGPAELKALRQMLVADAKNAGDDVQDMERMFDIGIKSIMGRSTEENPNSKFSKMGRALRDIQFVRLMNKVGFTLFTELGPVVARAGVVNTAKSIAVVGDFMRRGADGQLKSKEARYIEDLVATGTEHLRNPPFMRLEDDAFMPSAYGNSKWGVRMDNLSTRAQHLTSIISGMAPMNTALQRISGRAILLRLMEMANSSKPLSEGMTRRMRSYGLDADDQAALFASLKGIRKIDDLAETAMPHDQRERIAAFMFAATRHAVLEGDASDSIMLMHSAGGKIITQFRSFMAYSYERHFLNSAYHWRDWNTYTMVGLSTTIAGLQWAARTYLDNAHDPEKLKERLTWGNFSAAAVSQSSWGGVVPAIVDTAAPLLGQDPVFANSRSTGLSTNLVGGIPAVDWANRTFEAMSIPGQAISPTKEVTTREAENALKVLWFQNVMGWQNLQSMVLKEAEEHGWLSKTSEVEKQAAREKKDNDKTSWTSKTLFGLDDD